MAHQQHLALEAAEAALSAMQADGRAWACDVDALRKVRSARLGGASTCLTALRCAEASLTEMVRDQRATSADVAALTAVRRAIL